MASGEMVTESVAPLEEVDRQVELESIAMRKERPVLAIKENVTQLVFIDQADSEIWGERIKKAKSILDAVIPAVGRVDLRGAPLGFVGTGWLVAENVIVTNRHVANEFAITEQEITSPLREDKSIEVFANLGNLLQKKIDAVLEVKP